MAVNGTRLEAYLSLERVMLELDEVDDDLADHVRDAMDPVWYALTDEEHAALDARGVITSFEPGMSVPLSDTLFSTPIDERVPTLRDPLVVLGWELAA